MMRFLLQVLVCGVLACPIFAEGSASDEQLIYFATWPHQILIFDAAQEKVVGQININSDVAQQLVLSPDRKKLYALTVNDNSLLTIDLTTRKQIDSMKLNEGNRNIRLLGMALDPSGKYLYTLGPAVVKQIDHYDVEPTKIFLLDLQQRRITRSVEFPKDESLAGFWRIQMKFSPDGKYFYMFLGKILVFDTATLKIAKTIDLADPHVPGVTNVVFNPVEEEPAEDPNEEPGKLTNVFMSSDPYVHRSVFGIARIDLATLSVDFRPVAPVTTLSMTPLLLTPDHQFGYAVAIDGPPGNRHCEFWGFDMKTRNIVRKKEFAGRNRFSFALSPDGNKLLIYGAGFEVDIYDAKNFELRNSVTLPGDMTSNIIVMPGNGQYARASGNTTSRLQGNIEQ